MKNKKIENIVPVKLKTFDQVFKKSFHSKEFQHAYSEEMTRLKALKKNISNFGKLK